jgi:hypothetical protein
MVSLQQNWRTRGQNRFCMEADWGGSGGGGRLCGGEVAQTIVYTCKVNVKMIKQKEKEKKMTVFLPNNK